MLQRAQVPTEADGVFEGGGVKGIAFAGAIGVAEEAGVREWENVAGTSAGAIVASLLARGLFNSLWARGLAPGRYFTRWLEERTADSPLARELGKKKLTFADLARADLPADLRDELRRRALPRAPSSGRMLILPDAIAGFASKREQSEPLRPDDLGVVAAVRMSMSFPYLFTPVRLWHSSGRARYLVDGGLLSNFPVWLFDSGSDRPPARPTRRFRLHGGEAAEEQLPYHRVPMPFWRLKLARAMFQSATEAWGHEQLGRSTSVRTVSIPTRSIGTTDFGLSKLDAQQLYDRGRAAAEQFFKSEKTRDYLALAAGRDGVGQ